jgi:hypothetical protein
MGSLFYICYLTKGKIMSKTYVVRAGFNFRVIGEGGALKVYHAGDNVTIDEAIGDKSHQLEPVKKSGQAG